MRRGPFYISATQDLYEKDRWLHWLLWFIVGVYVVAQVLYTAVLVNNTAFEHTYVKHPSNPGVLTSDRYTLEWWAYTVNSMVVVLFPMVVMMMIIYRKQYGCNVFWFLVFFLAFAAHTAGCVVLSVSYAQCNADGQANNQCNSKLWCCAPEIYSNPANDCANTLPCTPPVTLAELTPDVDFVWFYWTNIYFALFHIVFAGLVISYWWSDADPETAINEDYTDEEEVEGEEYVSSRVSKPKTTVIARRASAKGHRLKQRVKLKNAV
jgi:hypothetical protein